MKKIGIIGGLGPESTKMYYDQIIEQYKSRAKGQFPEIIIYSVNMEELKRYLELNDLGSLTNMLTKRLDSLVNAGADFVVIASNTPHIIFDRLQKHSKVPMISIVEEAAKFCLHVTVNKKVGLLGTGFTMKNNLYPRIFKRYGLDIFVPDDNDQNYIHDKIFSELAIGIVNDETKKKFIKIVDSMVKKYSIDSLVLGCTELPLIFDQQYFGLKYINTVTVHVQSILNFCFQGVN